MPLTPPIARPTRRAAPAATTAPVRSAPVGGRPSRDTRRRLRLADRAAVARADAAAVDEVLQAAVVLLERGWVQGAWSVALDRAGRRVRVLDPGSPSLRGAVPTAGCLVAALVHAGGGPGAGPAGGQPVRRAVTAVWHAAFRRPGEPVQWAVAPVVRAAQARDPMTWNDVRGRGRAEVVDLVTRARVATAAAVATA